jgi:beta-galactosidase
MQDAFARPRPSGPQQGQKPFWSRGTGVWWLAFESDLSRGESGPFLVTETNASSIGDMWSNFPAYDGQWRQAAWTFVARGARMVEYWHWHTLHHGTETYWGGVLGHSLTPGRTYAEVARIGAELAAAGADVVDLVPDVDVAFVRDNDSRWALQFQPPVPVAGTDQPDLDAYDTLFGAFYRGFHDAGLQAAVIDPRHLGSGSEQDSAALVQRHRILVVPALYIASDEALAALEAYAAAGGHLVLTFRTGYADPDGTARHEVMPGRLREAVGASYLEYSNLSAPLPVVPAEDGGFPVPAGATATAWVDGLQLEGATALVGYEHPHFGRWPAITTHATGAGRVTYVGTLPDAELMGALARWLVPTPANAGWTDLPASVTVTGATAPDGRHLSFVSNWSHDAVGATVPADAGDVLSGAALSAGDTLQLGPWDVRVVRTSGPSEEAQRA